MAAESEEPPKRLTAEDLLKRINGGPSKEDLTEAANNAPSGTVLYCDRYHAPKFKYIPTFPRLPSGAGIGGDFVYFYGFVVTAESLTSIYHKHKHEVRIRVGDGSSILANVGMGMHVLKHTLVRYHDAYLVNAQCDDLAMEEPHLIHDPEENTLWIIAVACTRTLKLFYSRPSLEQMQLFEKHLGCKPRWFKDTVPTDKFRGWGE
ncbi:hypothetical protein EV421DRAFT_1962088 [Armillaria borealis]|uniref:Uncharacterized protein n=1 Tax=Armillaria borealis TaxID=47425 RepID=A0AA39JDX2_9AGAR|nr:hypothetical protein EV421DRAFT_1962088 [Armillaria borealis]